MADASINHTNVNMPTPRETSLVAGSSVPCSFSCDASDAGDAYWRSYVGVMPAWTHGRIQEYQKMARSWLQSLSLRNALSQRPSGFKFVPACSSNFHMDICYCRIVWFASWCMHTCVLSLIFRNCSPPLLSHRLTNAGDNHGEPRSRLAQVVPNFNLSSSWNSETQKCCSHLLSVMRVAPVWIQCLEESVGRQKVHNEANKNSMQGMNFKKQHTTLCLCKVLLALHSSL